MRPSPTHWRKWQAADPSAPKFPATLSHLKQIPIRVLEPRGATPGELKDFGWLEEEVVEAFLAAARDGDFDALVALLDPDIVERVDTGSGTIVEVRGAANVARRAMAAASQRDGLVGRPALVNGAAG